MAFKILYDIYTQEILSAVCDLNYDYATTDQFQYNTAQEVKEGDIPEAISAHWINLPGTDKIQKRWEPLETKAERDVKEAKQKDKDDYNKCTTVEERLEFMEKKLGLK